MGEGMMTPRFQFEDLCEHDLEQLRRFVEEGDQLSDELHALVEKYWPWLLEDAPPRVTH